MPSIASITNPAAGPAGAIVGALSKSPVVGALVGAGVGLLGLISQIGAGRKTANKMTGPGGPQDIIDKQLKAISESDASAAEKSQATDLAWRGFLTAANQFASTQGPRAAQVVQQAIYKTPDLTNTVKTLLGKNPLDPSYTSSVSIGPSTPVNTGGVPWGTIAATAAGIAAPVAINALQGGSVANVNNPGNTVQNLPGSLGTFAGDITGLPPTTADPGGPQGPALPGDVSTGIYNPQSPAPNTNTPAAPSLLSRLLPTLVSPGVSLLNGVLGYNAATKAATTQADASTQAAQLLAASGDKSVAAQTAALDKTLAFNRDVLNQQQQNLQPWLNAGTGALTKIQDITNNPGFNWNQTFTPPTAEQAMQDPGIQFQLQQGQAALEQYERAHGKLLSGGAIKDINQFAQGVASTGYQNVYNRAAQTYGTNYGTFQTERAAQLNPQLSLAGLGQVSTGNLNADLSQSANLAQQGQLGTAANIASINQATAQNVANAQTQAAANRASGYVAGSNAITGAAGQIGSNLLQQQTIAQILAALGRQPASA